MKPGLKNTFTVLFFGITFGILMGISIRYPLTVKTFKEAEQYCTPHQGLTKVKVGISGKVYEVTCADSKKIAV
jgi:hypothetical protein